MSNSDQDATTRRRSSPSPSPSTSHQRPRLADLDFFTANDIEDPLPSPPYTQNPFEPHISFGRFAEPSPEYHSRSSLDTRTELTPMADEKHDDHARYESDTENEEQPKHSAKTARFRVDVVSPCETDRPHFDRTETFESDRQSVSSMGETDDDDSLYDWSGEEDLADEEANFEETMGVTKKKRWGPRKYIALIFGSLLGSTLVAVLLITPPILVHFFWFKPHPTDHRMYVKDNLEAWLFWVAANITISWYLAFIIDIIPIAVQYLISAFWGHVSETVKSRTELYVSVKDTLKPLFYAASVWASWVIIFENIYELYNDDDNTKSRAQYTNRLYQVVEFVFFFALVICVQQMLSHAVAFSFHRMVYKERLEKLQETLKVVEHLRTYRPKKNKRSSRYWSTSNFGGTFGYGSRPGTPTQLRTPTRPSTPISRSSSRSPSPTGAYTADEMGTRSGRETDVEDSSPTTRTRRGRGKGKGKAEGHSFTDWFSRNNVPKDTASEPITPNQYQVDTDSPLHQYPPVHRHEVGTGREALSTVARTLKTTVLHDARNIAGRENPELGGLAWSVSSSWEAKRLAKSIYAAFRTKHNYLTKEDLYPAYPKPEEAEAAFRIFDADNNGDVNRGEIKATLVRVYRERRAMSKSMRDVSQALRTLNQILLFFAMVILLFISLSVFDVNVGSSLTSLYTLGIGLSFIFKNSASNAFDAVMFLFVTHPFDTGDRCFIDDENLVVKKMGLFATVFQRADGTESYFSNSQLFAKFLINARRSDKTAEGLTLQVDWRTPWEKLDKLADCMNEWLATDPNRWFEPSTSICPQHIDNMRTMEITMGIPHNSNWQNWDLRLARRTTFSAATNYYCRMLGITTYESTLPIAYIDPDNPQDIVAYPGEDYYDGDNESDLPSSHDQKEPPVLDVPKEIHRQTLLGFQPPSDKPMPGRRIRKAKSKKAAMRTVGADG